MKHKIDIDHICELSHLKLTEEEKSVLAPQMIKIVEWVTKLEELKFDVTLNEIYSSVSFPLPFRSDEVLNSLSTELALSNSPEKNREFIRVPKVIEEK